MASTEPARSPADNEGSWCSLAWPPQPLAVLISTVVATVVVAMALLWRRASAVRRRSRTRRQIASEFPDVLDLLVLSIRAGYLPARAVVEIEPFLPPSVCDAFQSVGKAMDEGMRFADALSCLSKSARSGRPTTGRLAVGGRQVRPAARARPREIVLGSATATPTRLRCRSAGAACPPCRSLGAVHAAVVRAAGNRSLAPRSPLVAAHVTTTERPSTERGPPCADSSSDYTPAA